MEMSIDLDTPLNKPSNDLKSFRQAKAGGGDVTIHSSSCLLLPILVGSSSQLPTAAETLLGYPIQCGNIVTIFPPAWSLQHHITSHHIDPSP
jgi:hypothetical protein